MDEYRKQYDFTQLVLLSVQGDINPEQMEQLDHLLKTDPTKIRAYVDLMELTTELSPLGSVEIPSAANESAGCHDTFLHLLAEEEKTAPAIEIPKEEPPQELIQKVVYPPKKKHKVSKFSIVWLAINAAAVLFIVLFLKLSPPKPPAVDVATLVDQMNVQWVRPDKNRENGSRLWTDEGPQDLKQGIVKIRYDNGVDVVIEGPALFEINKSAIFLEYGRLYSCVSESGLGFRVETPNSQFLDHGTEFGVLSQDDGSSELHVIKGQVELFTGSRGKFKSCQMISEKKAIRYDSITGQVNNIPIQKEAFARSIHSESKMVWRGGMQLKLADIVGGGNGFEGGILNTGIEASTGKTLTDLVDCYPFEGAAGCHAVPGNPYIDGVFIPGAGEGKTAITSDGSSAVTFPHASGRLWGYIFNGAFHQGTPEARSALQLDGVIYGTPEHPAITMHSNQGITFDLSEIRKSLPGVSITAFRSLAGISETVQEVLEKNPDRSPEMLPEIKNGFNADRSKVEFWIFLDGKQAFHREISSMDKAVDLNIPIDTHVRFLTLAVTESDDDVSYDWAMFGRPELILDAARK